MSADSQLDRAARVLDLLADAQAPLRYSEIQAGLDQLNAASLNRLLHAMTDLGILHHDNTCYWATERCAHWAQASGCRASLSERADEHLRRIHDEFELTTLLLEQQGKRIVSVAKYVHEHAPALMPLKRRFPPRLPYFGCIFFTQPDEEDLEAWAISQMQDIDEHVALRIQEAVKVTKRFLKHGYYLDREIYPGQTRFGVPIRAAGRCHAVLGAAGLTAMCTRQQEGCIMTALQEAAAVLSV